MRVPLKTATLWRFHRSLAYASALAVVVWAGSGLLHPLLNFIAHRPVTFAAPPQADAVVSHTLPAALAALKDVATLRLVAIDAEPFYQVGFTTPQPRRYLHAATGTEKTDFDRNRAIALAEYYTGRNDVQEATLITEFSLDYPPVNVFLPAWSVRFASEDGFTAVVETGRDALVRLTDDRRQTLLVAFQVLHTLPFLPEPLRLLVITLLVGGVLIMAVAGIVLLLRWKGRRGGVYRWHRVLAWVVMVPVVAYPVSGLLHLWVYAGKDQRPAPPSALPALDLAGIVHPPDSLNSRLLRLDGATYWRTPEGLWQPATQPPAAKMNDSTAARQLAGATTADARLITQFTDEYGFANRILPVWRVETPSAGIAFVDVIGAAVVTRVDTLDTIELWSFNELHKWRFLRALFGGDFKAAALRDALQILLTSLIVVLAGIGLWMRVRKP